MEASPIAQLTDRRHADNSAGQRALGALAAAAEHTDGPTMTSCDACTAAGRVPCLEAWPAAVFASAKNHLKSFVEHKGALSTLKRCTGAAHNAWLTACVCYARARVAASGNYFYYQRRRMAASPASPRRCASAASPRARPPARRARARSAPRPAQQTPPPLVFAGCPREPAPWRARRDSGRANARRGRRRRPRSAAAILPTRTRRLRVAGAAASSPCRARR